MVNCLNVHMRLTFDIWTYIKCENVLGFQVLLLQKWTFAGNVIYFRKFCPFDSFMKKPKLSYWGSRSSEMRLRCWVNGSRPFGSMRPLHGNLDHLWWRQYIESKRQVSRTPQRSAASHNAGMLNCTTVTNYCRYRSIPWQIYCAVIQYTSCSVFRP
jgi:hypothetical protein